MEKIEVYLPADLKAKVVKDAEDDLVSESAIVRKIIKNYYELKEM
ncbi:hypothetical protein [Aneurinibacillus terranovensis]|nr:hypothetical protein [Aneurinibacillus terranovensis]